MRAEIISVGTELLLGDIVNTNAQYLAQQLAGLGVSVYYQTVVGDNYERLRATVMVAKNRSDILVLTGGLGPTDDDLTKQTVADAFHDTLVRDEAEAEKLRAFFKSHGRTMAENNLKEAMVPKNGQKFDNPNGTAPGILFRDGRQLAFLLPGPPSEMRPMFEASVRPILQKMQDAVLYSHTLHVFGVGESDLENMVRPLLEGVNPTAALYAKTGEVHVRITARAEAKTFGKAMCEEAAKKFRAVLGDLIYSENGDDLETAAVKALEQSGATVATAESCTGGLLSERITSVPGASGVFGFGVCSYANAAKMQLLGVKSETLAKHGAVSRETAEEMAKGAMALGGATLGVGITGIAGPDGGTQQKPVGLVYVAVCSKNRVCVKKLSLGGRGREYVRYLATQHALDMVRRMALDLAVNGTI